jgi:hypothetical protein
MAIIVQRKRSGTAYTVPAGGEILWYGIASAVPSGFSIDSYCADVFVRGCAAGAASNTPAGANSHTHTNPSATGSQASHTHAVGGGGTGAASGDVEVTSIYSITYSAPDDHSHSIPSGTSSSAGGHSHTLSSAALADAYPPYARLYWIRATSDTAVPVGGIVMWDDAIADAPSGFALCNGSGGTIDLRDKFVYGASADGDIGDTGGAETHVHGNASSGNAGTHSHTASLTSGAADSDKNVSGYSGGTTVADGGHTHSLSATTNADADHSHTLSDTGAGSSLPSYVKLYFIQRTA